MRGHVTRLFGTIVVVVAVALSIPAGFVASDVVDPTPGGDAQGVTATGQTVPGENYTVRQGEACFDVVPVTSDESVTAFYDYRTPYADNEYTNATGDTYSSEGTIGLQEPNGSVLFLHLDANGTLSLIAVHGALNETSGSGVASFDVSGLPENGTWAVRDDEYAHASSTDNWSHDGADASIDWMWGGARTDGFAYSGLGDEFDVTINPTFDRNAAFGEEVDGVVQNWTVVSNESGDREPSGRNATRNRTELNRTEPVSLSTRECVDGAGRPTDSPNAAEPGDDGDDERTDPGRPGDRFQDDDADESTGDDTDDGAIDDGDSGTDDATEDDGSGDDDAGADGGTDVGADDDGGDDDGADDGGPGDDNATGDDGGAPEVQGFVWRRTTSSEDFAVEWSVTDRDGDLSAVTVELLDGGSVVATERRTVSGGSDAGEVSLRGSAPDAVRVEATDEAGNADDLTQGVGPPPEPETASPTPADGDPTPARTNRPSDAASRNGDGTVGSGPNASEAAAPGTAGATPGGAEEETNSESPPDASIEEGAPDVSDGAGQDDEEPEGRDGGDDADDGESSGGERARNGDGEADQEDAREGSPDDGDGEEAGEAAGEELLEIPG